MNRQNLGSNAGEFPSSVHKQDIQGQTCWPEEPTGAKETASLRYSPATVLTLLSSTHQEEGLTQGKIRPGMNLILGKSTLFPNIKY